MGWQDVLTGKWSQGTAFDPAGVWGSKKADPDSPNYTQIGKPNVDWGQQYQGIDWSRVPTGLSGYMQGLASGKGKIKDPNFGLAMTDYIKATQRPDTYGEQDIRNRALDIRTQGLADWRTAQRGLEDQGVGRGMIDSGNFNAMVGEAKGGMENQVKANIGSWIAQARTANEQDRQAAMQNAMNGMIQYLKLKQQKRQMGRQYADSISQMQNAADAQRWQNYAGYAQSIGSIAGAAAGKGKKGG